MASGSKALSQLSDMERVVFELGKKSFRRHRKSCRHRIPQDSGDHLCGLTGDACEFHLCPLLKSGKDANGTMEEE